MYIEFDLLPSRVFGSTTRFTTASLCFQITERSCQSVTSPRCKPLQIPYPPLKVDHIPFYQLGVTLVDTLPAGSKGAHFTGWLRHAVK